MGRRRYADTVLHAIDACGKAGVLLDAATALLRSDCRDEDPSPRTIARVYGVSSRTARRVRAALGLPPMKART